MSDESLSCPVSPSYQDSTVVYYEQYSANHSVKNLVQNHIIEYFISIAKNDF